MSGFPNTATGDGMFGNPLVAFAVPKITAALAGALGTYAAISPNQATTLATAIVGGALAVISVAWSFYQHRNAQAVVAKTAVPVATLTLVK